MFFYHEIRCSENGNKISVTSVIFEFLFFLFKGVENIVYMKRAVVIK